MKKFCCFLLFVLCAATAYSRTFSCPSGTEDMMKYFIMSYPQRLNNFMGPGNANPIYSTIVPDLGGNYATSGYFLWVKSNAGYPWDIKSFDQNFVYDRTTELNWNDPTSFKRFVSDLPMSPRCAPVGKAPKAIKVPQPKTQYRFFASCQPTKTQDLSYALNTISAPQTVNVGNVGKVKTRYFRYHYGCDSGYGNCSDMEVFSLGYQYGNYDWKHYVNQGGNWQLVQESQINNYDSGGATPYLPCQSSYK